MFIAAARAKAFTLSRALTPSHPLPLLMPTTTATTQSSTSRTQEGAPNRGGNRGGFRGRGRGRGRHRGGHRGGAPTQSALAVPAAQDGPAAVSRPHASASRAPKPPLTHFLALPLGHHAGLRARMAAFTRTLLDAQPAIPGLDASIVIAPRRLHLTLGVMSLTDDAAVGADPGAGAARPKTVDAALALLRELRPRVLEMLGGAPLRVALRQADVMKPERGDPERAHVMWVGPPHDDEDARRLTRVAEFVNKEFIKAGLVVDEKRPLKLHCTVLNTTYRRPRGRREPFSYASILSSTAFQAVQRSGDTEKITTVTEAAVDRVEGAVAGTLAKGKPRSKAAEVDFGEWTVDEIQICKMGSWGPEGEYVSVGHITLN